MAMFGLPGGYEWFIVLAIALLLFGRRLPQVAKGIGECIGLVRRGADKALDGDEEK